jgi:hypothetical protein
MATLTPDELSPEDATTTDFVLDRIETLLDELERETGYYAVRLTVYHDGACAHSITAKFRKSLPPSEDNEK